MLFFNIFIEKEMTSEVNFHVGDSETINLDVVFGQIVVVREEIFSSISGPALLILMGFTIFTSTQKVIFDQFPLNGQKIKTSKCSFEQNNLDNLGLFS